MFDLVEKLFIQKGYSKCVISISENKVVNLFYDGMDKLGEYYFVSEMSVYELINNSYQTVLSDNYYDILINKDKCEGDILRRGDIDKNSSLIFLINTTDIKDEDEIKWNSILLNIEEDELYFKKYVLDYKDKNLNDLKGYIDSGEPHEKILSYYKEHFEDLKSSKDEVAKLALKIIAKTPFFNYFEFDVESIADLSLNEELNKKLSNSLKNIHNDILKSCKDRKTDINEIAFLDKFDFGKYKREIEAEKDEIINRLKITL